MSDNKEFYECMMYYLEYIKTVNRYTTGEGRVNNLLYLEQKFGHKRVYNFLDNYFGRITEYKPKVQDTMEITDIVFEDGEEGYY